MEATAIQSVEKNITMVALANVQPSNYNPRKNFDEASLAELSESIRQQGVLQPIGVRPMSDCKFGQDEDKMIYFFLLSSLRKEHFEAVGIEEKKPYSYLTDEEKINIIANLTSKQKAIIRRDFLIANFKNAYGNNATASLLLDFAQKHMPDLLADIKNGHNEVYEKRHQRIEEKKAVLLVQEQAKQEAEQSDKQQSEVGMQTEEQPQEENIAA